MALAQDTPTRAPDAAWLAVAVCAGVLVVGQLLGTLVSLVFGRRGLVTVEGLGGALAAWWFAKGAWLRTKWGRPPEGMQPAWDEPALTTRRAGWYVWLGAGCVVAAAVAISIQALSWVD